MWTKVIAMIILMIGFSCLNAQSLPTDTTEIFSGSGNCAMCHEPGPPNNNALRDLNGNDISPVTLWRSTMMANAAKDPFWQAKVTAEVLAHPQYQQFIEDKCTTCHAPIGHTQAHADGQPFYSLQEVQNDPLALDGVSCTVCHQIKDVNLGTPGSFSGHYIIENDRLIYGPYLNPFTSPMEMWVNYTPVFGEQVEESELCATCHTLFTPTIDNDGNIVGEIAEQTPYLEWVNSIFPGQNKRCQSCHQPEVDYPVVISNRPVWLSGRAPFPKHYFAGANVFMLRLLKDHGSEIGVTATPVQFDSTIARTLRILQKETADISATYRWISGDSLEIRVAVKNKSGHKFPTGYPSRRAWLYVGLRDGNGQPVFESGGWDAQTGEINGLDIPYEVHHDVITAPDEVQIYQAMMQDVDGNVTYTLLRGASYIKDNRLPPEGFTSQGPYYDSAAVTGLATQDPNFNIINSMEGSGADTVTYHIGNLDPGINYQMEAKLLYQSITPRYAEDLFQYSTPEVQTFQSYYQQADKSPVTVDSLQLTVTPTGMSTDSPAFPKTPVLVSAYPNPFNPTIHFEVEVEHSGKLSVDIYNLLGEKIFTVTSRLYTPGRYHFEWNAQSNNGEIVASGVYIVEVVFSMLNSSQSFRTSQRIVYLK
ncbi:MAG: T9SS C-terminal target domain-containing protein [Calditrichaeota bacterium]|nr:MAG: T9SS C-terminal target domain-containing protein [Calditrichota bacterium]